MAEDKSEVDTDLFSSNLPVPLLRSLRDPPPLDPSLLLRCHCPPSENLGSFAEDWEGPDDMEAREEEEAWTGNAGKEGTNE